MNFKPDRRDWDARIAALAQWLFDRRTGLRAGRDDCCPLDTLHFTRPVAPAGATGNRLDLVWVYAYDAETPRPTSAEGRAFFEKWALAVVSAGRELPTVVPASSLLIHQAAVALAAVLGSGAIVTGALWLRGVVRPTPPRVAGEETEALLRLVDTGQRHLRSLRALLFGLGPIILYVGLVIALQLVGLAEGTPGPSQNWALPVRLGFLGIWLAVMVVWAAYTWTIHRTLRRWTREEPPMTFSA
jgi:hypothetical protein